MGGSCVFDGAAMKKNEKTGAFCGGRYDGCFPAAPDDL